MASTAGSSSTSKTRCPVRAGGWSRSFASAAERAPRFVPIPRRRQFWPKSPPGPEEHRLYHLLRSNFRYLHDSVAPAGRAA